MVATMARDMGQNIKVRDAVGYLVAGLAENRRVIIVIPKTKNEDLLAVRFISKLLDTGIGKALPKA